MTLYNCKAEGSSYLITKFTRDLDMESSYLTTSEACECPAGARSICRHRIMLPRFIAYEAVHGEAFFDYDRSVWIEASTEAALEKSSSELNSLPGITVIGLDDPALLHNTIAEALGEPSSPSPPSSSAFDRRF